MFYNQDDSIKWQKYINDRLQNKMVDISNELYTHLKNSEVSELDYCEFFDKKHGEYGISYMHLKLGNEQHEVHLTSSLDDNWEYWGFLHEDPNEYFNSHITQKYALNPDQEEWVLDVIKGFFDIL